VVQPVAKRHNDSAALARTLGTAYYRQGDYPAAQSALEQALSLDNSSGLAYLLMGCTLEKLGQTEAAGANFEQARRLDPRLRMQR
jgi:Tfp pilus assembly protein PilF